MKKTFFSLSILLLFAAVSMGQTTEKSLMKNKTTEEKIMQIEQTILDSILQSKYAEIEPYYADNYIFTSPDARQFTKNELISSFKSGVLKIEASKTNDMKIVIYGDTAIVRYKSLDKGIFKDQNISGTFQWTDVFVKLKGNWVLVSTQGTPIN